MLRAVAWLRETRQATPVLVGVYSFGAVMAMRAAGRSSWDGLLLVAPPVGRLKVERPELPTLVILGDQDQFVEVEQVSQYFASNARVEVLSGADHFFMGESESIRRIVSDFITSLAN
ncbi:MAG: hypothetical protein HUJ31_17175 [Pseudomonadales bacterium]|nr:hypothetical protein [Pseudomonadales bacterium]